ncbi:hypothetical protein KFE25_005543 [Diacronema lutheri]|uniref:RCC1-like domain-containing protein n=1 Tax=Diacronema lutheri TaxID=2081491 RepID=A0A8J5XJR3_DIALT|nr:hypothetical protein KFE25_005543 [Diacronema lutheri]
MLKSQANKWCAANPLRQKFTADEKKTWTKAERGMYKSAYELGGEPRATAVMRNYFAQQQVDAGAPASADDGAPAAAESAAGGASSAAPAAPAVQTPAAGASSAGGASSAAPAAPAVQASAPSAGGAAASDAELVRIEPAPLSERKGGKLLVAGSAAWEDVGKRTLSLEDTLVLPSFHAMLPGLTIALVITGPSASHALALTATGDCYVWGRNSNGQLGLGHTEPTPKPTALALRARGAPANAPAESIVGGAVGKAHTLLITARGTLYSCGSAAAAQLGHSGAAKQGKFVPTPRAVAWPHAAAPPCRVAAGADFSIATDTAGRLYSWGHPQYGQLGNGTTGEFLERSRRVDYAYRTEPVLVQQCAPSSAFSSTLLPPIGPIACGDRHVLACSTSGQVFSWGFGGYGRLGLSDQADRLRPTAVPLPHGARIVDLVAGGTCSYAVTRSGGCFFWGRTKSTGEATMRPKTVSELHGWPLRSIACGHTSTFVASGRSLISWGPSPCYGELGYGAAGPGSSTTPKLVDDLEGALVEQVAAGYAFSAVLVSAQDEESAAVLAKRADYEQALTAMAHPSAAGGEGKAANGGGKGKAGKGKAGKAKAGKGKGADGDGESEDGSGDDDEESGGYASGDADDDDGDDVSDAKPTAGKKRGRPPAKKRK